MKVIVSQSGDLYQGSIAIELVTEEKRLTCQFGSGEPEDMVLARDLNDALGIDKMLIAAYEAGKAGEELITEYNTEEEE